MVEKLPPALPHGVSQRSVDRDHDVVCPLGIEADVSSVIKTPPRRGRRGGLAFANPEIGDDGLGRADVRACKQQRGYQPAKTPDMP